MEKGKTFPEIIERIEKLTGRQARIALLSIIGVIKLKDYSIITSALDVAETYPKDE